MKKISDFSPIKQRFYMVFESTGLTQAEFGRRVGKSQNQISAILNDRSNVSADMIQLMKYKLNVNPDFILKGSTPMFLESKNNGKLVPLIADIPAGPWESWLDSYEPGAGEDYIAVPDVHGKNLFAIRVKGDSMEPKLRDGDVVIIDPNRKFQSGVAVVRHHWGYKIRNVRKIGREEYRLWPLNPAYEEEVITRDEGTRLYVPIKVCSLRDI